MNIVLKAAGGSFSGKKKMNKDRYRTVLDMARNLLYRTSTFS